MSSTKPGKRREGREAAVQFLYSSELSEKTDLDHLEDFWSLRPLKPEARAFSVELIRGVLEHKDDIDRHLTERLQNYRLERLGAVDRNVLRLAIYELLYRDDIPDAVAINEAIEIARRFGTTESPGFVNGILDGVRKARRSDA